MIPPDVLARLMALPQTEETWIGGRRPLPSTARDTVPVMLVSWASMTTDQLVGTGLIPATDNPEPVMFSLCRAMLEPEAGAHEARRPRELIIDEEDLAELIGDELEPLGIEVAVGGGDVLDELIETVSADLDTALDTSLLDEPKIQPDDIQRFYAAEPDQVLGVSFSTKPMEAPLCVSINEDEGLTVYVSVEDWEHASEMEDEEDWADLLPGMQPLEVATCSLHYVHAVDVNDDRLARVETIGCELLGPGWYPELDVITPDVEDARVSTVEVRTMTAVMAAVSKLVREHADLFMAEEVDPVTVELTVPGLEAEYGTITIVAPHPDVLAMMDDDDDDLGGDDIEDDETIVDDDLDSDGSDDVGSDDSNDSDDGAGSEPAPAGQPHNDGNSDDESPTDADAAAPPAVESDRPTFEQ